MELCPRPKVSAKSNLTVCDKLLLAAYGLDGGEGRSFSAEDLVVAAWERFPRAFGLRGYHDADGVPRYPDSNRVFAEVMGSKPIRKRGHLVKIGQKTYALTPTGRQATLRLQEKQQTDSGGEPTTGKATLSRDILGRLDRLLDSRAVLRAQQGEFERITFHDACVFWGITPRSTAIELEGSLANVAAVIRETESAISHGASERRTGKDDLAVTTGELLRTVHRYLQEKFADELTTIRKRTHQRKT